MKKIYRLIIASFFCLLATQFLSVQVALSDTIKIGIIGPFSGPYSIFGQNFKTGIDAYLAQYGNKVGDHNIEILYRDVPDANPALAKSIAQSLIVKDKIQYIGGFYFTPNAMAVAPLLKQGNVAMIVMNAATSSITAKSPNILRTSFTMWQNSYPLGQVVFDKGIKKMAIAVSDYGPGIDAENAFKAGFTQAGGEVVEALRIPLSTNDFSPIMQRIKDSGAEGVFAFLPTGPSTIGFMKAYSDNGLKKAGISFFATGDISQESDLAILGDNALDMMTSYHYALSHDSAENKNFIAEASKLSGGTQELSFTTVAAYDGMYLFAKMIAATNGKQDATKAVEAVKGLEWQSPRGPVKIDPISRHIIQNVYLRTVEKDANGRYFYKEVETLGQFGDLGFDK